MNTFSEGGKSLKEGEGRERGMNKLGSAEES